MATTSAWLLLAPVPNCTYDFPLIFDSERNQIYAIHKTDGLLRYSFDKNSWNLYKKIQNLAGLPSTCFGDAFLTTAIDSNQIMYLCAKGGQLATLHIDSPGGIVVVVLVVVCLRL